MRLVSLVAVSRGHPLLGAFSLQWLEAQVLGVRASVVASLQHGGPRVGALGLYGMQAQELQCIGLVVSWQVGFSRTFTTEPPGRPLYTFF